MAKRISFYALSNTGFQVRLATMPGFMVFLVSISVFISLVIFSIITFDYYNVRKMASGGKKFEEKVISQRDEIECQRKQIQEFAKTINELKLKLASLNDFEKKIRIIANIENISDKSSFFGVGGSMTKPLNVEIPIEKKQNSLIREMHEELGQICLASKDRQEGFAKLYNYLEDQQNLLAATPAIRPVNGGWISSGFGYRVSPFTGRREFHKGLDIATRKGEPIIATANGVVTFAGTKGLLGKTIIIDHGHGLVTRYGHASKLLKKKGDVAKRGDVIALIGNSGRSTGPHVHYDVRLNGISVNPQKYILN